MSFLQRVKDPLGASVAGSAALRMWGFLQLIRMSRAAVFMCSKTGCLRTGAASSLSQMLLLNERLEMPRTRLNAIIASQKSLKMTLRVKGVPSKHQEHRDAYNTAMLIVAAHDSYCNFEHQGSGQFENLSSLEGIRSHTPCWDSGLG